MDVLSLLGRRRLEPSMTEPGRANRRRQGRTHPLKTIMHNGHILRPARHLASDYVLQKCDLCGYIWETIDDCAESNLRCIGVPRRLPIIGRVDRQYGWRKVAGASFLVIAGSLLYDIVIGNKFYPGDLGLLIASVVVFLIFLFLALLFWPDQ